LEIIRLGEADPAQVSTSQHLVLTLQIESA
jgi:hypothetical protein